MPPKLTVGSCFSGIGGLELGLEWTGGFETRWQIEIDPYASAVLKKHWPDVQRYSDITTVSNPPRVDVICGGFPCQDVSLAGARAGLEGKRSTLWSELFRLVCEVRPRWLVAENVPGLLSSDGGRFMGNILRDLASIGFDAEWGVLSAAGVGAPHLRRRLFLLAHPMLTEQRGIERKGEAEKNALENTIRDGRGEVRPRESATSSEVENAGREHGEPRTEVSGGLRNGQANRESYNNAQRPNPFLPDTSSVRQPRSRLSDDTSDPAQNGEGQTSDALDVRLGGQWSVEPNVGRVAHGVPSRVDRLRCLGNAVVPQVAQRVGEMILDYEKSLLPLMRAS